MEKVNFAQPCKLDQMKFVEREVKFACPCKNGQEGAKWC